ncbi:MAG: SRPBCC domain-containing protein [Gammaproteobacteria bacterium]|nr:SRPBCC domain-containing protein [Gammaproteobacteria bacterium]MDH5654034.1 SRPBCC domain-containing protein [Gammaproteobacteria bacterium]
MNADKSPLEFRRQYRHQIHHVFNAFATAEAISQWFAPHESIKTNVTQYEFYTGGRYRMEFTLPDGITTSLTGEFHAIDKPAHLAFSFCWEKPDPHADIDTLVSIDLLEDGEYTQLIVSHIKLKGEDMRARHNEGWLGTLSRLDDYLNS